MTICRTHPIDSLFFKLKLLQKKVLLKSSQNSQENTSASNFIKKETLAQGFFCEFCEMSKNSFSTEHNWTTSSEIVPTFVIFGRTNAETICYLLG